MDRMSLKRTKVVTRLREESQVVVAIRKLQKGQVLLEALAVDWLVCNQE
jgi:hypothetical protein